ncbi:hypothetical protein [Alloalcanivorax xenomutans]
MRIVVKGAQGVGKTHVAAALSARSRGRLAVLDEWDGQSELPDDVVAITNAATISLPNDGTTQVIDVSIHGEPLGA